MNRSEFKELIESIDYVHIGSGFYKYKDYTICLYDEFYRFYNGSEWFKYDYNDLTPLMKLIRSYKLKQIL